MRTLTKFLTTLSPIAIVGTIVPTVVSCGGSTFVINYGDAINCKDKKADNYQKLKTIQKAVSLKANKQLRSELYDDDLARINGYIASTNEGLQMVYFDLIASYVLFDQKEIILNNWSSTLSGGQNTVWFSFDGATYGTESKPLTIQYGFNDDEKIEIQFIDGEDKVLSNESYTFSDCTKAEE